MHGSAEDRNFSVIMLWMVLIIPTELTSSINMLSECTFHMYMDACEP